MEIEMFEKIVSGLYSKTDQNLIGWFKTSSQNEYQTRLGQSSLTIDKWENALEGATFADLAIYNTEGDQVDRIFFREGDTHFTTITDLLNLVERRHKKIDETYKDILDNLS